MTTTEFDDERRKKYSIIARLDEVGRRTLARPLVTAAVILPAHIMLPGVQDSKKTKESDRDELVEEIKKNALAISVTQQTPAQIDEKNILQADRDAMQEAVQKLPIKPDLLLIDGNKAQIFDSEIPEECVVKGDSKSLSIAAASIIAKYVRDKYMIDISQEYPGYGFEKHKGYGTKAHIEALNELGPSTIHRMSFKPVKKAQERFKK